MKAGLSGAGRRLFSSSGFNPDILGRVQDFLGGFRYRFRNPRAVAGGVLAGVLLAFMIILIVDFYRVKQLSHFQPNITTKIFDKNDVLISELFRQKREVVPLKEMPKNLMRAFVAIEDNEFYEHWGVNPKGIVRAFFINVFSGRIRQGGSTITQQLAKILLTSGERNIFRKVKEAFIAVMMEMFYTKDEILEIYLNQIFLGHGAYGVESASRFYFNKHVSQLNLAECALLATLPASPNNFSPIKYPKRSIDKHKIVLAKMVEMGYITIPEAEKAFLDFWPDFLDFINDLPPTMSTWSARVDKAPWFTEHVRRTLIKKYGEEMVYEKGLLVYTTLDVNKQMEGQKILEEALKRQTGISRSLLFKNDDYVIENYSAMAELFSLLYDGSAFLKKGNLQVKKVNDYLLNSVFDELDGLNLLVGLDNVGDLMERYRERFLGDKEGQKVEGCLISIDHRNGYIEAMVGGGEFSSLNQLNRAMQARRQAGSAIKPLIYSAAMESRKFTPATTILDSPTVYLDTEGGDWIPENYEGEYYGLVRLRKALAFSINVASIRIADTIGIDAVIKYYGKLLKMDRDYAKKHIPRNFSIALGSLEVSPFELARAYAIIANGGKDVVPFSIRYVKDRGGKILENGEEEVRNYLKKEEESGTIQVLEPATAQIMISLMTSVINGGTGAGASLGRPAAGKTGTTSNWKDAWFCGFTPQLTTCIWMGYDKLGLSLGIGQAGGAIVTPVWGRYMRVAMKNEPALGFPVYAGLEEAEICSISGMQPSSYCKDVMKEVFIPGTVPEKECDMCQETRINRDTLRRGPKDNISREQKEHMMKNLNRKKGSGSILNKIGDDLLE